MQLPTVTDTSNITSTPADTSTYAVTVLTLVTCLSNGDVRLYTATGEHIHTYTSTLHDITPHDAATTDAPVYQQYVFDVHHTTVARAYGIHADIIHLDRSSTCTPFHHTHDTSSITSLHTCVHGVISTHASGAVLLRCDDGMQHVIRQRHVRVVGMNREMHVMVLYETEEEVRRDMRVQ